MSEAPYDYAAKGRSDYEAGRRDNRLYEDQTSPHAALYRRGWQDARLKAPWGSDPAPGKSLPVAVAGLPLPEGSPASPEPTAAVQGLNPAVKQAPKRQPKLKTDQMSLF